MTYSTVSNCTWVPPPALAFLSRVLSPILACSKVWSRHLIFGPLSSSNAPKKYWWTYSSFYENHIVFIRKNSSHKHSKVPIFPHVNIGRQLKVCIWPNLKFSPHFKPFMNILRDSQFGCGKIASHEIHWPHQHLPLYLQHLIILMILLTISNSSTPG